MFLSFRRKSFRPAPRPAAARPRLEALDERRLPAHSTLVYPGTGGQLLYTPDAQGDRIPDFSNVGYRGGDAAIPTVPVRATVGPGAGDDGARIQAAIDAVSAKPLGADGFRGAVLLTAGEYQINGSIQIRASGVVLRGAGDGTNGTVLRATGTSQRTLVQVAGSGSAAIVPNTTHAITDKVVPVGARSFRVASTAGLQVGDRVMVRRPSTAEWISAIDMDQLAMPWQPGSKDIVSDRVITRIEGDRVTLDAPLTNSLDQQYGGGTISKYTWAGRIQNVGVEHVRGVSDFTSPTDEAHSWRFVAFSAVENGWARDVTGQHFAYAAVEVGRTAKWVTVEDSQCLDPVSEVTGGRRYSFAVDGQLNLVRGCYARGGRHDFVMNGSTVPGPNVFLDCRAEGALSDTGPHQRWITGGLFDNVEVQGNGINVQNRGNSGTGHGWAGANMVVWNSTATGGFVVQNPPTAQNWLIGSVGPIRTGTMFVGPTPQPGVVESHGTPVDLRSLYEAQLADRLANPGAQFREYALGDFDGFARDGAADDVFVDPAWRAAVDAATTRPLVGFDVGTNKTAVPFTFQFALAPGETVVGATLSLGLRATGSRTDTDTIRIDSLSNSFSLSSLGLLPLTTGATTGRVIDLGSQLALLADGRLNVMVSDDTAVDWAVLNLRVVPGVPPPPSPPVGGLQGGGFEAPDLAAGGFQYNPGGSPWAFGGQAGVSSNGSGFTGGNPAAPEGDQVAFLQNAGTAAQTVSLAAGTYQVRFSAAQRGNFNGGPQAVRVVVGGTVLGTFTPSGAAYQTFTTTSFTLSADGTREVRLEGVGGTGDRTALVDLVEIVTAASPPVPVALANAGFESPAVGGGNFQYNPSGAGWAFSSQSGVTGNGSGFTAGNPAAPQGQQVAFLQGAGSVGQAVSLQPGTYTLTFRAAQRGNFQPAGPQTVRAQLAGTTRTFAPSGTDYQTFTGTFAVATAGTYTLLLDGLTAGDSTALLDDVLLTRVG